MNYIAAALFIAGGLVLIVVYFHHRSKKIDESKFEKVQGIITQSYIEESFSHNTGS